MARPSVEVERREQILRSASRTIAQKGIKSLRIADVAAGAGVSAGIIHYYFNNKQTLTRAAFERNFEHSLARRASILNSSDDAPAKLRAVVDAYLPDDEETVEAWHVWAELWVEGLHDQRLQELNERAYGEWRGIISMIVRAGQSSGHIREGDPVEIANMLIGMLDGLALQVLVGSRDMTLERMRRTCHGFVQQVATEPQPAATSGSSAGRARAK